MIGPCQIVSIHAPVRGATPAQLRRGRAAFDRFNPRAREGRDDLAQPPGYRPECFNPRAREGRDSGNPFWLTRIVCFNPRAREGRDGIKCSGYMAPFWFQSTRP